jgi:L-asparagine transporter-like permease
MGALSEMAVAHPTAGSFSVYAELYVNRWAGFVIHYTYWAVQCIAIGGEATAVAIYCHSWFPGTPQWAWIVAFSAALVYVNARSVGSFGAFEFWFAMIKVVALFCSSSLAWPPWAGWGPLRPSASAITRLTAGFCPWAGEACGWPWCL